MSIDCQCHPPRERPAAFARFRGAVDAVRAAGVWRDDAEAKSRAGHVARLADAARIRVNFLTDLTRQRIDALDALRGRTVAYGRDGRHVR